MDTSILVVIILVIILILFFIAFLFLGRNRKDEAWKATARDNLNRISANIDKNDANHLRTALIDHDKLLDYVLKNKGLKGESMGERLKNASAIFDKKNYNNVWEAHKMRNKIVHEIHPNVSINELKNYTNILKYSIEHLIN